MEARNGRVNLRKREERAERDEGEVDELAPRDSVYRMVVIVLQKIDAAFMSVFQQQIRPQQQAKHVEDIDTACDEFLTVIPGDAFYVSLDNLRGSFQEREVMKNLNVSGDSNTYRFDYQRNKYKKKFIFLAGMRGSGKTSELARYAQSLHKPDCFFVVTCNIDKLDMQNVQYMDIVVFQLERLLSEAARQGVVLNDVILDSLNAWFAERVKEINRSLTKEAGVEVEIGGNTDNPLSVPGLLGKLLGFTANVKAGLSGSVEQATTIRQTLQNRFSDFAAKFNIFIEQAADIIRRQGLGQEVLFIVDGLEKTYTAETRRKIIMDEAQRMLSIQANTVFTLPIELMHETQRIQQNIPVISFPFIKLYERTGVIVESAFSRFEELVSKRIDTGLFDSNETIREAIRHSGGSPRQLLKILKQASWEADETLNKVTRADMEKALDKLANQKGNYVEPFEFEKLKQIKTNLEAGVRIVYDKTVGDLLEEELLFEYNDGGYKRVCPLLERSTIYRQQVLDER
jgi:hypothetical protein